MSDVRQKTVKLYQALEELIDQNGYGPKLVERRVLKVWSEVLPFGQFSKAVSFQNGLLSILVFHSSWLTELHYQQQSIIEQLNRHLGHQMVKKLAVKISTKIVERAPDMRQISQTDVAYKKVTQPRNNHSRKETAELAVSGIQDPQCRLLLKQIFLSTKLEMGRTKA